MKLQYLSIFLVVISSVGYHICQKSVPSNVNPLAALMVTYACSLLLSIVAFIVFSPSANVIDSIKSVNWASVFLGVAILGLELGFLLAYRSGWSVSIAGLLTNISAALLLIPIGMIFYKEVITIKNMSGVLLCLLGLILISR